MIAYYTQTDGLKEFHVFNGSFPRPLVNEAEICSPDNDPELGGNGFVILYRNLLTGAVIAGKAETISEAKSWLLRYYPIHPDFIKVV